MNEKEIFASFKKDWQKIETSTVPRLLDEYRRERKKYKIDDTKSYPKHYPIRTKAKNNWIIFLHKPFASEKFKKDKSIAYCCVTYYHDKAGLNVLRYMEESDMIEVFWGHFFARYNERLNLGLSSSMDIVKHFFTNTGYLQHRFYEKQNGTFSISVCRDGLAFGEVKHEGKWLINKTFVTKDMRFPQQHETEKEILPALQAEVLLPLFFDGIDLEEHEKKSEVLRSLNLETQYNKIASLAK